LKALILAGGFATRLRPLSCTRPKILFPIINKPLLEWTFEGLAKNKVKEVILATSYGVKAQLRQARIPKYGMKIAYSLDPLKKPLGTGGPIKKAENLIGHGSSFLVINGDVFTEVDYAEVLSLHRKKKAVATIVLRKVEDPSRFGVAKLGSGNHIERFIEKPRLQDAPSNLINAGVYALSPQIFEYIPKEQKLSLERDVFPVLAERGELYGYVFDGLWTDIGKPEDYLEINRTMLKSLANSRGNKALKNAEIKMPATLDKRVTIGRESVVGPYTVLGQGVTLGDKVRIRESVVLPETVIQDSTSISGAIIGEGVIVGKRVKIARGCMLGDHARINDDVTLAEGVTVCPAKEVTENVLTAKCIA